MSKDEVVAHLEAYARSFAAPVREGVRVTAVERDPNGRGFLVRTDDEPYAATRVVRRHRCAAAAAFRTCAADLPPGVAQVVPYTYRNPAALPPGAVLVVGSGESGCQIAEELRRAGRTVYSRSAAVGGRRAATVAGTSRTGRAVGWFEPDRRRAAARGPDRPAQPQLTGSDGGHDLSVHTWRAEGVSCSAASRASTTGRRSSPRPGREPGVGRRAGADLAARDRRPHAEQVWMPQRKHPGYLVPAGERYGSAGGAARDEAGSAP